MRTYVPILAALCAMLIGGCTKSTDPDPSTDTGKRDVTMTHLTDIPMGGGDVAGIAVMSDNSSVAIIDGKLYSIGAAGGTPELINGDPVHIAVAVAPSGEIYTVTPTEFRTYNRSTGAVTVAPIDPSGPLSVNGRVDDVEIRFSPSGEPFVALTSNYPHTYIYYSTDKGATWTALKFYSGGIAMRYSGDFAFTPSGEIIAGDYEGLYKTADKGETWTLLNSVMPNAAAKLLMAANGDIYRYVPGGGNLSVSHNGGTSFTDITLLNKLPFFIDIQQGADGALYSIANTVFSGPGPTSRPMSLLRSTDNGMTWTHLLYGQAHGFSMHGSTIAIGLVAWGSTTQQQGGGVCISRNSGTTWTQTGLGTVKSIDDFGFDREGNLLILADNGIFRRVGTSWETLGSQLSFRRFAATPSGGLLAVDPNVVYYSSDDGVTWSRNDITDYLYPGIGRMMVPMIIGRRNGEFLMSITTYRDDLGTHTNGRLYRIGADGKPTMVTGANGNFVSMVEDANGILYGSTVNFSDALTSTDGGNSWGTQTKITGAVAYNSVNKYLGYGGTTGYTYGKYEDAQPSELTLNGFTLTANYIHSAKFGPDDRLYLLTLDQGIFISQSPLK